MLTKEEILTVLRHSKRQLAVDYGVSRIGLFGSFASDAATDKSDVDILVAFKNTDNLYEKKAALQEHLTSTFNRPVDLCTEKYVKPYFKEQILKQAIYV